MSEDIIIAGFGGQGVMLMGQLLAYAGMMENKNVVWLPSYGPEMRGGTANCSVIVSDNPISSPMVTEATTAIVLNKPSLAKFKKSVSKNGNLLINKSLVNEEKIDEDIHIYNIPATDIALTLGNTKVTNMVMLGSYIQLTNIVKVESLIESLKIMFGETKANLIDINKRAITLGAEFISK